MTLVDLRRRRERRDIWRAGLVSVVGVLVADAGVMAAHFLGWPVHWATVALIVLCVLFGTSAPLLFDVFDHSFVDASIRIDLSSHAQDLAAKLYPHAKLPSITIWNSPAASYDGNISIWLGTELHIAMRKDIDAMPTAARDFALAHAVDSILSARGFGWGRVRALLHWLPVAAALLLAALFGEWVILGSCLWVLVPMIAFLLWHKFSRTHPRGYGWFDKRHLAIDRRAAWATSGMAGARAWYTERMAATEGFQRETFRLHLIDLERAT